jgi:protein-disulfide isomerase
MSSTRITGGAGALAADGPSGPSGPTRAPRLDRAAPWATLVARLIGGVVLAIAALDKIGTPQATVLAVRAYRILPESAVHPVAYAMPAFELTLAILLVLGVATRVVAGIAAGLMVVFIAAVSSAGLRGLRIDCGCFGGGGTVAHTHYLLEIGRDILLVLVFGVALFFSRSHLSFDEWLSRRGGLLPAGRPEAVSNAKRRHLEQARRAQARANVARNLRMTGAAASAVLVVAALLGIAVNSSSNATQAAVVVAPPGATASGGIVVGNSSAPVHIVVYEDPQCPVCNRFEETNGPTLHSAVDAGRVAVEYRMRSFLGPESVRADNALAAAQAEGKFEPLRETLFAHQPKEASGGYTTADLLAFGRSVGLTDPAYVDAVTTMKYKPWVKFVDDQASRDGNVGTPQIVKADGQALTSDQTFDPTQFKAALGLS